MKLKNYCTNWLDAHGSKKKIDIHAGDILKFNFTISVLDREYSFVRHSQSCDNFIYISYETLDFWFVKLLYWDPNTCQFCNSTVKIKDIVESVEITKV